MAFLLSLESSTTVCSAALHEDGKCLASLEHHIPQTAASQLAMLVENLFKSRSLDPRSLSAVAVSAGPGSYTGLRIGVATAKGLCYSMGIPLIAVNTLELLAYQIALLDPADTWLCPMIDARRMEVYSLLSDANLNILESTDARVIDESSFAEWLRKGKVTFFGNGAAKCRNVIQHPNARFLEDVFPKAEVLGEMAHRKFVRKEFEDVSSFEPLYLKDFVLKKPKHTQ